MNKLFFPDWSFRNAPRGRARNPRTPAFPICSYSCVDGLRARGLRPRPGMTTSWYFFTRSQAGTHVTIGTGLRRCGHRLSGSLASLTGKGSITSNSSRGPLPPGAPSPTVVPKRCPDAVHDQAGQREHTVRLTELSAKAVQHRLGPFGLGRAEGQHEYRAARVMSAAVQGRAVEPPRRVHDQPGRIPTFAGMARPGVSRPSAAAH